MKKSVAILGYLSLSMIIVGSLFKIQHWPGAGLMIVLGTTVFATVFLLLLLTYRIKNRSSRLDVAEAISQYFTLLFLSVGLMFKVQHWPGAGPMLIVGISATITFFLPIFFYASYKEKNQRGMLNKLGTGMAIAGILMVVALKPSKSLLDSYVHNNAFSEMQNAALIMAASNIIYQIKNPDSNAMYKPIVMVNTKAVEIYQFIDAYKKHLIIQTNGLSEPLTDEDFKLENVMRKDNYDIPTDILVGADPMNPKTGMFTANALKEQLISYEKMLVAVTVTQDKTDQIKSLLSTDDKEIYGETRPWETALFYHATLASSVETLTNLQNACLTASLLAIQDMSTLKQQK